MATKKPSAKLKNSNKLFKEFLNNNADDIANNFIRITAQETVYHQLVSHKKICIDVWRLWSGSVEAKSKQWQVNIVRQLKECGFVFYSYGGTTTGKYEKEFVCKFAF